MLSQEYPSVPMTFSDSLCVKKNYTSNAALVSRRVTHKRLSIHRLLGGVFNDGIRLKSQYNSSDESSCGPACPLSAMKPVKSVKPADGQLSVIAEDSIFGTDEDHDEADQQDDSSSSSSGDKKSFMQRILEVKDEMPADQNDAHVNIVRRNDLQTCEAAPKGYMDVHEFLKTKKPKSRLVTPNDIRLVGYQVSQSDSVSESSAGIIDYECTVLPAERAYYRYAALLESIPLPQPETFYDA
ncbi:unnamed protein product [Ambrosiozyma monospora]|uniref:Unnamed protein product n=1 Tax=Ambrosiozyma monospora TaxID=43982 RepID=A0ACB5T777_AMBMO|nr:unnamed protein product [Ambrosiozyma monospora]